MGPDNRFNIAFMRADIDVGGNLRRAPVIRQKCFAQHGAQVVVSSRKQDAVEAVTNEINAAFPGRAIGIACNISHKDQLKALVDRVELYFIRKYSLKQSIPGLPRHAFVIMVGATEGERTFEGSFATLKEFFSILNANISGRLTLRGIEKTDDLKKRPGLLAEARAAGAKFVEV